MVALGNFFFRYRTVTSPLLLVLLFLPGPAVFRDPFAAAIAGLVIATLGQAVRAAAIGLNYVFRGGRNGRVYAEGLVTEGLFSHARNPLYIGKFFIVAGVGVASNSWPAALVVIAMVAWMYAAVVRAEEDYLRRKFGAEFDAYCRRVPRWRFRFGGLRDTLSMSTFDWSRVLTQEYSAPLTWIVPIVVIGLYRLHLDPGPEPRASITLLCLLALAMLLWLAGGWAKKIRARSAALVL